MSQKLFCFALLDPDKLLHFDSKLNRGDIKFNKESVMGQLKLIFGCLLISFFGKAAQIESSNDSEKKLGQEPAGGAITQNCTNAMGLSIEKTAHDAFLKTPGLSEKQRGKLSEILKSTMREAGKIKMEIAAQKVDFFASITEEKLDNAKIKKIKNKIVDLDNKRLAIMLNSLEDVQKIIGKNPEAGKYIRNIMREHFPPNDRLQ